MWIRAYFLQRNIFFPTRLLTVIEYWMHLFFKAHMQDFLLSKGPRVVAAGVILGMIPSTAGWHVFAKQILALHGKQVETARTTASSAEELPVLHTDRVKLKVAAQAKPKAKAQAAGLIIDCCSYCYQLPQFWICNYAHICFANHCLTQKMK